MYCFSLEHPLPSSTSTPPSCSVAVSGVFGRRMWLFGWFAVNARRPRTRIQCPLDVFRLGLDHGSPTRHASFNSLLHNPPTITYPTYPFYPPPSWSLHCPSIPLRSQTIHSPAPFFRAFSCAERRQGQDKLGQGRLGQRQEITDPVGTRRTSQPTIGQQT